LLFGICALRNAIQEFLQFFTFKDDFEKFVIKLRECYTAWLKKGTRYLNALSSEGTEVGAVKEVS